MPTWAPVACGNLGNTPRVGVIDSYLLTAGKRASDAFNILGEVSYIGTHKMKREPAIKTGSLYIDIYPIIC